MEITTKIRNDANKFAYLVSKYPKHSLTEVIALLQMPAIDINTAVWAAEEFRFVTIPKSKPDTVKTRKLPKEFEFGQDNDNLMVAIMYSFTELAKKEIDLEETYLSNWTNGYPTHDVAIAIKRLIDDRKLVEYAIEDGEGEDASTYTFYTLFENAHKMWGRKQFKKDPLDGKDNKEQVVL